MEADNIVWGTSGEVDNIVWGTSSETDNVTWGCSGEETPLFDDPDVPSVFDGDVATFDSLFNETAPAPADSTSTTLLSQPQVAITTETTVTQPTLQVVGGGF